MATITNDACRICGKPLSDPMSVELGVGPVCRVTSKLREVDGRQQDLFGNERSSYTFEIRGDVVCVTDLDLGGRSVTNDVDRVIEDLVECLGTLKGKRVIYRNSAGVWDEIKVSEHDLCAGFRAVAERDLDAALLKLAREAARAPDPRPVTLGQFLSGGAAGFREVAAVEQDRTGHVTSVRFAGV
ncbi:DUF6011 domain-containing protein [Methylobacterium sp. J-059]|uniref:DUF6011 domain-containing protein n=1 Tax=Methylobacterium sp. J-059 TaxID=2836643 RepID=UPI001FBAD1D0|nr:DUF6011 domain-containing protein [Methylobacterium sp. J-059]MCJ2040848.1 DUF6011 domain-containing protein [Methylobacterium sp. J-059]